MTRLAAPAEAAGPDAGAGWPADRAPMPGPGDPTQWASMRWFAGSRIVVATVLVLLATLDNIGPFAGVLEARDRFATLALAYFALAAVLLSAAFVRRAFQSQLVVHTFSDLVALTLLMHAAGGARSGVGVLVVAAIAGAAVLATHRFAAFFAASATLMLLAETGWRVLTRDVTDQGLFVAAGFTGAACFLTAELVNRLATRLGAQQALARQRGQDLARQLAVTELVMTELPQGVVLLDEEGRVRAMNRSAQKILGADGPWPAVVRLAATLLEAGPWPAQRQIIVSAAELAARSGEGTEALHKPHAGAEGPETPERRLRVRLLRSAATAQTAAVLVLEDQREVEDRAQQLKLASMGRLSASIAHEIRNPLAAIRYANALLAEQLSEPAMQRLAGIVESNTDRIDRIVRDVLSVARREPAVRERLDVARVIDELLPELRLMAGARPERVVAFASAPQALAFDAGHLRQVLVNLVGNALRFASDAPGAVRIDWRRNAASRLELRVSDDGPGMTGDMVEHAFEPFFTTGTRGTGLGLYLAREICVSNQADLRYEPPTMSGDGRGAFVLLPAEPEPEDGR